jgi:cytochrome c oxidase subunit 2
MASHVHAYEKAWMAGAAAQILVFVGVIGWSAFAQGMYPPSRVETINPTTVYQDARFAKPGVSDLPDGGTQVVVVAQIWSYVPGEIHVPAGRPVTFRITSPDVTHGFLVVRTNVNVMVVPGYVTQVTTTFPKPGEYLIVCDEYCGTGHHTMSGKLIVETP